MFGYLVVGLIVRFTL